MAVIAVDKDCGVGSSRIVGEKYLAPIADHCGVTRSRGIVKIYLAESTGRGPGIASE